MKTKLKGHKSKQVKLAPIQDKILFETEDLSLTSDIKNCCLNDLKFLFKTLPELDFKNKLVDTNIVGNFLVVFISYIAFALLVIVFTYYSLMTGL